VSPAQVIIPRGVSHSLRNVGDVETINFSAFNSENPGTAVGSFCDSITYLSKPHSCQSPQTACAPPPPLRAAVAAAAAAGIITAAGGVRTSPQDAHKIDLA